MMDDPFDLMDEENPRTWKYCSFCGQELESVIYTEYNDETKPRIDHYDKFDGKPRYFIYKKCPTIKRFTQSDVGRHTYGAYESRSIEGARLLEVPY